MNFLSEAQTPRVFTEAGIHHEPLQQSLTLPAGVVGRCLSKAFYHLMDIDVVTMITSSASFQRPRWKPLYRMMFALLLAVCAAPAWSYCQASASWQDPMLQLNIGRVVVDPNLAVGAVIITRDFPLTQSGTMAVCYGVGTLTGATDSSLGSPVGGSGHIYPTKVAGIGIRQTRITQDSSIGTQVYDYSLSRGNNWGNTSLTLAGSTFRVELIKTSNVTGSGPLASGRYSSYTADASPNKPLLTTWVSGDAITIVSPSCTVDAGSKNIAVNFGDVPQSRFSGVGSTAAERNFKITLQCQQSPGEVYVRLDATSDPSNQPGVMQITQGGQSAKGVGIQLLDARSKQPITYGGNIDAGSSPSAASSLSVPFTASYYQTSTTVVPGDANGLATFTIQYQ